LASFPKTTIADQNSNVDPIPLDETSNRVFLIKVNDTSSEVNTQFTFCVVPISQLSTVSPIAEGNLPPDVHDLK